MCLCTYTFFVILSKSILFCLFYSSFFEFFHMFHKFPLFLRSFSSNNTYGLFTISTVACIRKATKTTCCIIMFKCNYFIIWSFEQLEPAFPKRTTNNGERMNAKWRVIFCYIDSWCKKLQKHSFNFLSLFCFSR